MQCPEVFVGVDVSKASLSTCVLDGPSRDIANDALAIEAWLRQLPARAAIAVESTGRYHRLLVEMCHSSGRAVFVLNASDVFFYAKALSARGKTDRMDAQVIARYLSEHHRDLKPWVSSPKWVQQLHELLRCRAGLADKRASLRQMLRDAPDLADEAERLDSYLDDLLKRIDDRIAATVDQDEGLAERSRLLRTVPGIGPQASAMLVGLFSRIAFSTSNSVVAYSGLDPRPQDSGTKTGRRRLSKRGAPELRRQMYLVALAAGKSKALHTTYEQIKSKGFKPTQALVILARKLLRVAWTIWKEGAPFDVTRIGGQIACQKP